MSEHVASKLKLFRELLGWTQEHLAEAAGLSTRTVQRAENGEEMSGETLQALAAVFDVSVAILRQPLPSEDEIRKAAEEAQKRYKFIPLTRIERASDLQPYMGADAWQVDRAPGLCEEQEDEIAVLEELLRDYGDLWSDLEPTHRREALKTIFESIVRLTGTGLIVAAGCDAMRLVTPGSPEPFGMDVLRVVVSKAEQPQLFAVREKNARVKFA
jgi:transcriptional regulator with XRE-family HTH domain